MRVSGSPGAGARACAEARSGNCPIERLIPRCWRDDGAGVSLPTRVPQRAKRRARSEGVICGNFTL